MNNKINFERIRTQVRDDVLAMTVEDHIDDFLRVLGPKMEANVQRRRNREKRRKIRQNVAERKKGVRMCSDIFPYLRKRIFQGNLALDTNSEKQTDWIDNQPHWGKNMKKEEINRYLERIGCNLRIL